MFIKFEAYIPLLISLPGTDKKIMGTSWQYVCIKQKHKKKSEDEQESIYMQ
jgi:hypothetical protein